MAKDGKDRRSKGRRQADKNAQMKGLKPWQPGCPSPNPGGRPASQKEFVFELRKYMPRILQIAIDIAERGARGEAKSSDKITSQHIEFLYKAAYGNYAANLTLTGAFDIGDNPALGIDGEGQTALLLRAAREKGDAESLAALKAEQRRIEAKLAAEDQAHEDRLVAAEDALSRGEQVDGLTRLVIEARRCNANKPALPAPRVEDANVVAVDSNGSARVVPPPEQAAAAVEEIERQVSEAAEPPRPLKPEPPFQGQPMPPPPPPPKPKYSGMPADAARHFQARDRARETQDDWLKRRQEEVRAQPEKYPGGQVPPSEFKPDPPERSIQGPPEVVRIVRDPRTGGFKRAS